MKNIRYSIVWLVLLMLSATGIAGQNTNLPEVSFPPSAELTYAVKAEYNGLNLNGNAIVQWKADTQKYTIRNEARISFLGKILDADSNGELTEQGLVPQKYTEKRLRKAQTTTLFNYTGHTVTFHNGKTLPLKEPTQDRASIVWQLASVAKAATKQLIPGATLTFSVAGNSKTESWTFHVINTGNISTPFGQLKTIRLSRTGKKDQKMDIWLAPDHDWYPVQILFNEQGGLQLLQTLEKVTPL